MGNDVSKSDEERLRNLPRQQGVSREEVNRLLEQQRREYERKLQELNVRPASNRNVTQPAQTANRETKDATDRNIDEILAQQLQDFVQIAYNNTSPSNSGTKRSTVTKPASATKVHLAGPTGERSYTPNTSSNQPSTSAAGTTPTIRVNPAATKVNLAGPSVEKPSTSYTLSNPSSVSGHGVRTIPIRVERTDPSVEKPSTSTTPITLSKPLSSTGIQRPSTPVPGYSGPESSTSTLPSKPLSSTGIQRPSTPLPGYSGAESSTSTPPSLERNRNPYRYTKEDLQNVNHKSPQSPQTNLYPNLKDTNAFLYHPAATSNPLQQEGYRNAHSCGSGEFVFVGRINNNQGNQPSAPPLPTGAISKNPNTSKQFKSRSNSNKNEDDELNCRTCHNKYGLTIFQCSKGHSSCRDCKIRSMPCGICQGPIGDTRNITLEAYISERKVPCPNSNDGCTLLLKIADLDTHMKECPFSDYLCPLAAIFGQRERCKWRGKVSQMVSHFDENHPEHRQANIDMEMVLINIIDDNHIVHVIDLSPYVFLVHLKVAAVERKIYMTVQLLGTKTSASKWTYELHVYNKREPRRKFLHTDVCFSNIVPLTEIFSESKCAAIPQSYAISYVNEGCLNYKFYIKREFDSGPTQRGKWRGGGRGRGRGRGAKANS